VLVPGFLKEYLHGAVFNPVSENGLIFLRFIRILLAYTEYQLINL